MNYEEKMIQPSIVITTGDVIEKYLESYGWRQSDLAEVMGVSKKTITYLVSNKMAVTPDIAVLLGSAFGKTATFWMNIDNAYRLRIREGKNNPELIEMRAEMRRIMPVAEIRKKGWFINDVSCMDGIRNEYKRLFGQDSVPKDFYKGLVQYCARQTRYDEKHTGSYCKIWYLFAFMYSKGLKISSYNNESLKLIAENIASYTSREDGVSAVIKDLNQAGVGFMKLSHLEKTYLDGACFLRGENPIIVITGRYDRIDNFWFVLAHEISHVLLHYNFLEKPILDDLHSEIHDDIESQADNLASNYLHKKDIIENGKRYSKYITPARLEVISRNSGVSVPVALGILQHEGLVDWRQFSKYRETVSELIPKEIVMG